VPGDRPPGRVENRQPRYLLREAGAHGAAADHADLVLVAGVVGRAVEGGVAQRSSPSEVLPAQLCARGFSGPGRGRTVGRAGSSRSVVSVIAKPERKRSLQKWGLWRADAIAVTAVIVDLLIRSILLALGAALFAARALIFTVRSCRRARQSLEVTQQDRVTGSYTKAIGKLGSKRLGARIGGVYALERIALGSPRDHPTVMEVLAAFIRKHSREKRPSPELAADDDRNARTTRPDVQAAVTVIGRRNHGNDCQAVNLNRSDLTAADLTNAQLTAAQLCAADLTSADLTSANLPNGNLTNANLTDANLVRANLRGANLYVAELTDADLTDTDLTNANLTSANLTSAQLVRANLTEANLVCTDLTDAQLVRANLTDANLRGANLTNANLTNANLTNALWPRESPTPKGWSLKSGSGRLGRASPDTGNPG
jgi:uncharacterized protein YjbI with pentapeptide repeats